MGKACQIAGVADEAGTWYSWYRVNLHSALCMLEAGQMAIRAGRGVDGATRWQEADNADKWDPLEGVWRRSPV
jgi:hypothetical protein